MWKFTINCYELFFTKYQTTPLNKKSTGLRTKSFKLAYNVSVAMSSHEQQISDANEFCKISLVIFFSAFRGSPRNKLSYTNILTSSKWIHNKKHCASQIHGLNAQLAVRTATHARHTSVGPVCTWHSEYSMSGKYSIVSVYIETVNMITRERPRFCPPQ